MSKRLGNMAKNDTQESEVETGDAPLIDSNDASIKKMMARAKKRGVVTYEEINEALPQDQHSSEQIEDIMSRLSEMGVNVVENDDADDEDGEREKEAEPEDEVDPLDDASANLFARSVQGDARELAMYAHLDTSLVGEATRDFAITGEPTDLHVGVPEREGARRRARVVVARQPPGSRAELPGQGRVDDVGGPVHGVDLPAIADADEETIADPEPMEMQALLGLAMLVGAGTRRIGARDASQAATT